MKSQRFMALKALFNRYEEKYIGKYKVYTHGGGITKLDPVEHAIIAEDQGAGEIFINLYRGWYCNRL